MFTATSFIFDDVPSEEYGVMLYFFDNNDTVEDELWTNEIVEDRLNTRYDPIFYGININKQMTFNLTIGSTEYLTKYEVERVADWLTSHDTYKWLEICQDDMQEFRYKAIFTEVKTVHINGLPVAFSCTVVTDSQFAYEYPTTFSYIIRNGKVVGQTEDGADALFDSAHIFNKSSYNGYLYPTMTIKVEDGCQRFSILNTSDKNRSFVLTSFPNNTSSIADIYQGLHDRIREVEDLNSDLKKEQDKILSFINEYKGYPNSESSHKITDSVVDAYLKTSVANLNKEITNLSSTFEKHNFYGLFKPSGSDSLQTSDGKKSFRVLTSFDNAQYVSTNSSLSWLSNLKAHNGNYKYNNYNLISAYNYFASLENNDTVNLALYEAAAKLNLIRAVIDYLEIGEEMIRNYDAVRSYEDQIEDFNASGNVSIEGDELYVEVDNKNQIMTCNRDNLNIYEYFGDEYGNHNFLRLVQGKNILVFQGSGTVTITCEFLRKVGV